MGEAVKVLEHPARAPNSVRIARVFGDCDLRCRDEGAEGHVLARIARERGSDGRLNGMTKARQWWDKNIVRRPGSYVLIVNGACTIMALVGVTRMPDGRFVRFYQQARFGGKVDLAALRSACLSGFGVDIGINKTWEQRFAEAMREPPDEHGWWSL